MAASQARARTVMNELASLRLRVPDPAAQKAVALLRHTGSGAILLRGPRSGRSYHFSSTRAVQDVDSRDVEALLRTGLFRRVEEE